jgi:flagellar biosynthesis protein FlhF
MPLEILTGSDVPSLLQRARRALGTDAVVVSVRRVVLDGRLGFEMTAADPATAESLPRAARAAASPATAPELWTNPLARPAPAPRSWVSSEPARPSPPPRPQAPAAAPDEAAVLWDAVPARPARRGRRWPWARRATGPTRRPLVVAVVGPTGAGKTTTIAKLATHARAFAGKRVAFACLDTYRVAGAEQLRQYAELARVPMAVAYDARDAERALHRFADVDVVLVDTAGRAPGAAADHAAMHRQLLAMGPDEVHLVLPAGLQAAVARDTAVRHLRFGVTHVLATKLDEVPAERVVFDTAAAFGLPMRWIANGQEVPDDLALAPRASGAPARQPVEAP